MLSLDFPGAPYGDVCRTCNDQVAYSPVAVQAWHGTGGRFAYACRAGHAWGCGWSSDEVWNAILITLARQRFVCEDGFWALGIAVPKRLARSNAGALEGKWAQPAPGDGSTCLVENRL